MKFLIAAVFALFAAANAQYLYDIHVQTGGPFNPQYGNMYVLLRSSQHANNISMSYQPQQIVPNYNYVSAAQSPIAAPELASASFQWLNPAPAQAIRLARVTTVPKYLQEPNRTQYTRFFCANGVVPPGIISPLYPC